MTHPLVDLVSSKTPNKFKETVLSAIQTRITDTLKQRKETIGKILLNPVKSE